MKQPVRCPECGWTGQRVTDLPLNAPLPKPCPEGHVALVGGPPPSSVETTPSGVEISFWDSENIETGAKQQRRYLVDGKKLPSVTTILRVLAKDALLDWAANLAKEGKDWREVRDDAGERGRQAHDLILRTILKERTSLADLDEEFRGWGQAAFRWLSERRPKVLEAERMVASVEHGFAGRIDLLTDDEGSVVLKDFKTSSNERFAEYPPYPEHALQLDCYAQGLKEVGLAEPDYGMVIRLGPDGSYDETPFELDPERGLAILGAYRARSAATSALKVGLHKIDWAATA